MKVSKESIVAVELINRVDGEYIKILEKEAPTWCFPSNMVYKLHRGEDIEFIFNIAIDGYRGAYEVEALNYAYVWSEGQDKGKIYCSVAEMIMENLEDELLELFIEQGE